MSELLKENLELENLKNYLQSFNIDISQYGKGGAKTVEDLLKEIQEGETVLTVNEDGRLLRSIRICRVDIFYTSPDGQKLKLVEERQFFSDGRERVRKTVGSVGGKFKKDEAPEEAAVREIQEELGILGKIKISELGQDVEVDESPSYPGLLSQYIKYNFTVNLEPADFKPEGYIEKTDKLTSFFVWKKVN